MQMMTFVKMASNINEFCDENGDAISHYQKRHMVQNHVSNRLTNKINLIHNCYVHS